MAPIAAAVFAAASPLRSRRYKYILGAYESKKFNKYNSNFFLKKYL